MADFLESLGQGLRGAGAILSSPVYEQQNREQNMMLAEMQRRRAELGRALVVGIESGAVDPNNDQVKMTLQRLGIPGAAFGPSPQAQVQQQELKRSQAFSQWLQQQRAGGLGQGGMGGGLTPSALRDVPPEVAMSPEYQALVKRFTELKNLEKPTEHFDATSGNLIRSYPDGKTEVIPAEPGRKAPTMRTRISGDQEIQEEYDPATKTWKKLGEGPRFARQVAPVINMGGADKFTNVYKDPETNKWFGISKQSGKVEEIPFGESVKTPPAIGGEKLTPDQMRSDPQWKFWIDRVIAGGDPPQLAWDKQTRKSFLAAVGAEASAKGITGVDQLVNKAGLKADQTALSSISRLGAQVLSFEGTAIKNLDVALEQARSYVRADVPILDKAGNIIRKNVADKDIRPLQAALITVRNEYAKISASATAAGQGGTRADREELDHVLSADMSLAAIENVAKIMKRDMENRRLAIEDEKKTIEKSIGSRGLPKDAAKPDTPSKPKFEEGKVYVDSKGRKAKYVNGKWEEVK